MVRVQNRKMMYKILMPVSILLTIALSCLVLLNLYNSNKAISTLAERELHSLATQHGNDVASFIAVAVDATANMVSVVETMKKEKIIFSRYSLITLIRGFLNENKDFVGSGSGWEKNAYDNNDDVSKNAWGSDEDGLFIPYISGTDSIEILTDIEISDWYTVPRDQKKQIVTDPYVYKVAGKDVLMTTAATPIIINNVFKGVITVDVALDVIISNIKKIHLYDSGYGFLMTQAGVFIAHPDESLLGANYFNLSSASDAKKIALQNGERFLDLYEDSSGEPQYVVYHPIKLGNSGMFWYLVISVPEAEVLAESRFIMIVSMIAALITLFLALLVIFIIIRSQVKPLAYMAEAATAITQGNLQYDIDDASFSGEMQQLSGAIRTMIGSLATNISEAQKQTDIAKEKSEEVRKALEDANEAKTDMESKRDIMMMAALELEGIASIITSAAQDISMQITNASQGAQDQATRIAVTAEDIASMNEALLSVANNANASAELSTNAKNEAIEGADLTEKCKTGINVVRNESLTLKDSMTDLSQHAQNINDIMSVISDIADQTNLLALNAAIEAARAGDAGRGFAVVADEVRKLAEKTMTSTIDVGNAIRSIQKSADTSVQQVDSAVEKIQNVTLVAEQCGDALKRIVEMIDQADSEVRTIAITSEEQSNTSGNIANSFSKVKNIAEETLNMMHQSNQAVFQLSEQAQSLSILIERMKQN